MAIRETRAARPDRDRVMSRTGDLGNVIGATSIGGRRSDFFTARKLAPGNLGLLQQNRHKAAEANDKAMSAAGESRDATVPDVSTHQR